MVVCRPFSVGRFTASFILLALSILGWFYFFDNDSIPGTAVFGSYRDRHFVLLAVVSYFAAWSVILDRFSISRSGFFRIVSIHSGLLAVVALLETFAMVGVIDFRQFLSEYGAAKHFGRLKPDKRLKWALKPNQVLRGAECQNLTRFLGAESEPIPFEIRTDRFGLRNPGDDEDPDVLVLGDSVVFGGLIRVEDTVPERLESILGIRVMNLSEPGYSPQEELVRLETTGISTTNRIVLHLIFGGNDLLDSRHWRAWMQRRLDSEWPSSGLAKNLLGLLHQPRRGVAKRRFGFFTDSLGNEIKVYFMYDAAGMDSEMGEFTHLESFFLDARTKVESGGGKYAIVFVPAKITVLHRFCRWPEGCELRLPDSSESLFCAALREFCSGKGIPFRDLTPPLESLAEKGILPYFPADTHLNAGGHEAVALFLAPWVRELGDRPTAHGY